MSVNAGLLAMAAFLATITNRLVEGFIKPVFVKYELDAFWLMYIAWAIGAALVYFTGINLFPGVFTYPVIGQVLTALVAGGGANLLNDLFDGFKPTERKWLDVHGWESSSQPKV